MYGIFVFAILLIVLSLLTAQFSYVERARITMDLGLAGLELSIVILSIFLGATVIFREIDKRTILTLFTKPLDRWQFIIGKFIGLFLLIFILLSSLSLLFFLLLLFVGWSPNLNYLVTMFGFGKEAAVLISVTMAIGILVRPTLSVPISIGIFLIGKSMSSLVFFMTKPDNELFKYLANFLRFTLPDLSRFDWKYLLVQDQSLNYSEFGLSALYCIAWVLVLNSIAIIVFKDKDIA